MKKKIYYLGHDNSSSLTYFNSLRTNKNKCLEQTIYEIELEGNNLDAIFDDISIVEAAKMGLEKLADLADIEALELTTNEVYQIVADYFSIDDMNEIGKSPNDFAYDKENAQIWQQVKDELGK